MNSHRSGLLASIGTVAATAATILSVNAYWNDAAGKASASAPAASAITDENWVGMGHKALH